MKFRIFVLVLALVLMGSVTFAGELGNPGELQVYVSTNTTSAYKASLVSTSTIIPGKHKILGYSISAYADNEILWIASLRDAASVLLATDTTMFSENEVGIALDKMRLFPGNGRNISNGLVIHQGPKTVVEVYYVRYAA